MPYAVDRTGVSLVLGGPELEYGAPPFPVDPSLTEDGPTERTNTNRNPNTTLILVYSLTAVYSVPQPPDSEAGLPLSMPDLCAFSVRRPLPLHCLPGSSERRKGCSPDEELNW